MFNTIYNQNYIHYNYNSDRTTELSSNIVNYI